MRSNNYRSSTAPEHCALNNQWWLFDRTESWNDRMFPINCEWWRRHNRQIHTLSLTNRNRLRNQKQHLESHLECHAQPALLILHHRMPLSTKVSTIWQTYTYAVQLSRTGTDCDVWFLQIGNCLETLQVHFRHNTINITCIYNTLQ